MVMETGPFSEASRSEQMKRRTIQRIGKDEECGEMKVVVPPVDICLQPPADRVAN